MALFVDQIKHGSRIHEAAAFEWIAESPVRTEVGYFLTLVNDSNFKELFPSPVVNRIDIEHSCVALEIKLGGRLRVQSVLAVSHGTAQVAERELADPVARLADEGLVARELDHKRYHDEHAEKHEHHELEDDVEVGIQAVSEPQVRVILEHFV